MYHIDGSNLRFFRIEDVESLLRPGEPEDQVTVSTEQRQLTMFEVDIAERVQPDRRTAPHRSHRRARYPRPQGSGTPIDAQGRRHVPQVQQNDRTTGGASCSRASRTHTSNRSTNP